VAPPCLVARQAMPARRQHPLSLHGHLTSERVRVLTCGSWIKTSATHLTVRMWRLERLFIGWSKTGGCVSSWEFLAAHGCLGVVANRGAATASLGSPAKLSGAWQRARTGLFDGVLPTA
jgi:hypothetical protein